MRGGGRRKLPQSLRDSSLGEGAKPQTQATPDRYGLGKGRSYAVPHRQHRKTDVYTCSDETADRRSPDIFPASL